MRQVTYCGVPVVTDESFVTIPETAMVVVLDPEEDTTAVQRVQEGFRDFNMRQGGKPTHIVMTVDDYLTFVDYAFERASVANIPAFNADGDMEVACLH